MTEAKQQEAGRARSLGRMFGLKENYSNPEIEAAYATLDAREESND